MIIPILISFLYIIHFIGRGIVYFKKYTSLRHKND
jgi:hypothetical protein